MKKSKNGITIISVVIMIVLIAIIAGVTITQGGTILEDANLQTLNTNMLLVQAKVKTIAEKHTFNEEENPLVGIELSERSEDKKIQKLLEEGVIKQEDLSNSYIRIWDQTTLEEQEIAIDLKGEFYIVNYQTEDVIYSKGFKTNNGSIHYNLDNTINL